MPRGARRPPAMLGYVVGAAFLLVLVVLFLLFRPAAPPRSFSSLPPERTATLEAALSRSDLPAARAEAERLAKAYPRDARTFALLGDVLFGQGEKERALAAYREAVRLDPGVGAAPELLANLRATFNDPQHGEAAFRLAETIGAPAQPILSDLAADTHEARLKRRAAEAIGRIRQGEASK